ncbi:hypothetical protein V5799_029356 [Amblyomma americanum]|uniref:Secreted protein n=1 Tax=Amblyomma americanum TaxID=6943 RepID=A0AAQ4ERE6_AMBAM
MIKPAGILQVCLLLVALVNNAHGQFFGGFFPWWSRWCNGIWCPFGTRCVFVWCVQFPCPPLSYCAPIFFG